MTPVVGEIIGWEALLVLLIIALLFGSSQLPKLARSLGEASRELRKGLHDDGDGESKPESPEQKP
jgi:sec-independent protein translocase protein TatA